MITENDVCIAYTQLVKDEAGRAYGIAPDDALSAAWYGLLLAIRTWRFGMYSFKDYALKRIRSEIQTARKEGNRQRRCYNYSLDAPICKGETITLHDLIAG